MRHGRRSADLTGALQAIALALGGRAGARLSGPLAAGVSRMTLIRIIRALPEPAMARAPRVLARFTANGITTSAVTSPRNSPRPRHLHPR